MKRVANTLFKREVFGGQFVPACGPGGVRSRRYCPWFSSVQLIEPTTILQPVVVGQGGAILLFSRGTN